MHSFSEALVVESLVRDGDYSAQYNVGYEIKRHW